MKKTITATIAVLLIVALAITLASFLNKPTMTADAADDFLQATYISTHGQLPDVEGGHRTDAQAVEYWTAQGAESGKIFKITTGEQFYNYLNGSYSEYTHAYLANDVSFAYSGAPSGYDYTVSKISSNAVFNRTLDGNGYTLALGGGTGVVDNDGSQYYQESDNYNSHGSTTYRYTGFLMAVNKGILMNLIIDYNSNHGGIAAVEGNIGKSQSPNWSGSDNQDYTGLFIKNQATLGGVGGVIAGLNGDGGIIDNVRLNLNGNFKMITRQGNRGSFYENFTFVGGYVGRAGRGSSIANSQIVIGDSVGVYSGTQGRTTDINDWDSYTLAVAGGIVGKIDQSKKEGDITKAAVVKYCAVSGSGRV
ncbi:MAG: hypothetical protein K2J13_01560, partial [Clostridia bacterium]|nr:hypothetical protein [Clostridia bacterium]